MMMTTEEKLKRRYLLVGINKILVIFLIVASLFSCVGCTRNERDEIDASMDNEKHSLATTESDGYNDGALEIIELREDPKDIYNQERLYGTWYIDSAVLKSEMYTGTTMDGWSEEDLYDPADYIGFEIEYSSQFFRLGTEKYNNPIYSVEKETLFEFNEGGDFKLPSFLQLIDEKEIEIYGEYSEDESDYIIPFFQIDFDYGVKYDKYDFIPMGTQVVLLNDNTMLVGVWGKIMIAYRKE